jgi:hypothetical protein
MPKSDRRHTPHGGFHDASQQTVKHPGIQAEYLRDVGFKRTVLIEIQVEYKDDL